jgi:hypothetical protein
MSQMTMTREGLQAVYRSAGQLMRKGIAPRLIEKSLTDQGLDAEAAAVVVSNLIQARVKAIKRVGRKNMIYGALWCVGGIVVTALSYQAAARAGGGRYVLAWGAILLGGIQFVRGMVQSLGR